MSNLSAPAQSQDDSKEDVNNFDIDITERKHALHWNFGMKWPDDIVPKFKSLRDEALKNELSPLSKYDWNNTLVAAQAFCNPNTIGCCPRQKNLKYQLKKYDIKVKHIFVIKLYTDHSSFQHELRKCFIDKCDNDLHQAKRRSSFYHWIKELRKAFAALSKVPCLTLYAENEILYHGIRCRAELDQILSSGTYHGPLSTAPDLNVARDFAGKHGMVLVIKPKALDSCYKALDVSLISSYPQEKEVLLLDHSIEIVDYIFAVDYDSHHTIHKQLNIAQCHKSREEQIAALLESSVQQNDNESYNENKDQYLEIGCTTVNSVGDESVHLTFNRINASVYLLCAIYKLCAQQQKKRAIDAILKPFKRWSIEKVLYDQLLKQLSIKAENCDQVLSQYISGLLSPRST